MDADAKGDRIARLRLPGQGALDGGDHAGELDQIAVAHALDDAPAVALHRRIDQLRLTGLQARQSPRLIRPHQA